MSYWDPFTEDRGPSGTDVMQVCVNGHVINTCFRTAPKYNQNYCKDCGAKTITLCESCQHEIQGYDHDSNVIGILESAPSYCINCGTAFPWQQARIEAAIELAREAKAVELAELPSLRQSLGEIGKDGPRTQLAVLRLKKVIASAGNTVGPLLSKMACDIGTEAVKKHFGLP